MKKNRLLILSFAFFAGLLCCNNQEQMQPFFLPKTVENQSHTRLFQRFDPPDGFVRLPADSNSFAFYLRNLPLRPKGSRVLYFNGEEKENLGVYEAVIDLPIGRKDLHQCADAVIRLRAEHLWRTKQFDKIKFRLTNGFMVQYDRWRKGGRIKVRQNEAFWIDSAAPSDAYGVFWSYLELVFSYAGTLSLSKELHAKSVAHLKAGDVFIRGGSPGHAVIVVDMAQNASGHTVFLLAQSYMPAQQIQILKNPGDPGLSPWYSSDFGDKLKTPEWTFFKEELKAF